MRLLEVDLRGIEEPEVQEILAQICKMRGNLSQWDERYAAGKAAISLLDQFNSKYDSESENTLHNKYLQELFNDQVVLAVSRDEEYRVRLLGKDMHL